MGNIEEYKKIGLDDAMFLQAMGTRGCSTPTIIITLKNDVDFDALNSALEKTFKRYLHLQFTITRKKGKFVYEMNDKPFEIIKRDMDSDIIFGAATSGYPWLISYYGDKIAFTFIHTLFDGTGGFEIVKTLLHYYFEAQGIVSSKDIPIKTLDDDIDALMAEEFECILENYSDETVTPLPEKPQLKSHNIPTNKFLKNSERSNYSRIVINTVGLIDRVKHYETTPFAFLVPTIARALRPEFNEEDPIIKTATVINYRKIIGSKTLRNCHQILPVDYDCAKMDKKSMSLVCTAFRSIVDVKSNKENVIKDLTSRKNIIEPVSKMPFFIQNALCRAMCSFLPSPYVFIFSYTGKIDLPKSYTDYVNDFEVKVDTSLKKPALIEVLSYKNNLTLTLTDRYKDTSYLERLVDLLAEQNIKSTLTRMGKINKVTYKLK